MLVNLYSSGELPIIKTFFFLFVFVWFFVCVDLL